MAKGFGARLAEGLAEAVSITGQAYGNARMTIALEQRKEYQQKLQDERESVAKQEERVWREEEAVKEREHDFAKMEKAEEYDAESQERTLSNQLTLAKMRGSGRGGSSGGGGRAATESAYLKRARELEEQRAKAEGREVSQENITKNLEILNAGRSSGSSGRGERDTAAIQTARFKAQAKYGPDATDAQVAEFLGQGVAEKSDVVKPEALARAIQSEYAERSKMTHPDYKAWRKASEEERKQIAGAAVLGTHEAAGAKLPEEFVNMYRQQSQDEAPQSQAIPAPATSTQGEQPTDATPTGEGTQASPYVVETPEQAEWAKQHAPPGAYIKDVAGGRLVRKPIK